MTNSLLDVHVAVDPSIPSGWVSECFSSLRLQTYPVNVHIVEHVPGSIKQMRRAGFCTGTAPYVSYVDADDYVSPDCFDRLMEAIVNNDHVVGTYGLSQRINREGQPLGLIHPYRPYSRNYIKNSIMEIHQPVVMRRDLVLDALTRYEHLIPDMFIPEVTLFLILSKFGDWEAVDCEGYYWRQHCGAHKRIPHEQQRKIGSIIDLVDSTVGVA